MLHAPWRRLLKARSVYIIFVLSLFKSPRALFGGYGDPRKKPHVRESFADYTHTHTRTSPKTLAFRGSNPKTNSLTHTHTHTPPKGMSPATSWGATSHKQSEVTRQPKRNASFNGCLTSPLLQEPSHGGAPVHGRLEGAHGGAEAWRIPRFPR